MSVCLRCSLGTQQRSHALSGVGKSSIIRSLLKHYSRQNVGEIRGPINVVTGKKRRLTFIEVENTLAGMIDSAKVADLALLVVDAKFGFEMETFEYLNILQVSC